MTLNRHIIIDRDGVINHDSDSYIKNPNEWNAIDGSLEAIKLLTDSNFNIYIATNQSGINRGIIEFSDFVDINVKMLNAISTAGGEIAAITYCPSHPSENSSNRKPNIGMFTSLASRFNFSLKDCYSIGDSPRDIEASVNSGCKPIAVKTGNGRLIEKSNTHNVKIFDNLLAAVKYII